jgi:hypothetical protein
MGIVYRPAGGYCVRIIHFQEGEVMASKKKRVTTKSKRKETPSKQRKKVMASRKKKATSKKRTIKRTARKRVSQRRPTRLRRPARVVEDTIVDIIDEPLPGVMRVTEIEEVRVAVPDEGAEEDDKE